MLISGKKVLYVETANNNNRHATQELLWFSFFPLKRQDMLTRRNKSRRLWAQPGTFKTIFPETFTRIREIFLTRSLTKREKPRKKARIWTRSCWFSETKARWDSPWRRDRLLGFSSLFLVVSGNLFKGFSPSLFLVSKAQWVGLAW